jgi:iron complex transport system ATP-binding protein
MRSPLAIELSGVRMVQGGTTILDSIDWRVQKGENWALIGANGSGKTSLLSALLAYQPPTQGTIRVLGCEYGKSDFRELRTRVGIVSSALLPMMAGHEEPRNTILSGKRAMLGLWGEVEPSDEARAARILRRIECTHLAGRPWRVLSQGERQRVLIGRALMPDPELLILDEPCAGLDPAAREHFLRFLDRMARRRGSPSLVLVTHHIEEIVPMITHVLVLARGAVLATGEKKDVITSRVLSRAFGAKAKVRERAGRYELRITPASERIA